jgi:hypothetical protein
MDRREDFFNHNLEIRSHEESNPGSEECYSDHLTNSLEALSQKHGTINELMLIILPPRLSIDYFVMLGVKMMYCDSIFVLLLLCCFKLF